MAHRIDHTRAMIPPPTRELIDKMARAGYDAGLSLTGTERKPLAECGNDIRDMWYTIAQAMYATVALEGGASKIKLAEH